MDAKKSVRQYKPAGSTSSRRKKKKQSAWARSFSWFRSNIKDDEEVDPKKKGEHKDNLREYDYFLRYGFTPGWFIIFFTALL